MQSHKNSDHLIDSLRKFILIQSLTKVIASYLFVFTLISSVFIYQKFAFDHIHISAEVEHASFDINVVSESLNITKTNLTTPYSVKIPKGEKIKVLVKNNSGKITGQLKNGFSALQLNHNVSNFTMERNGASFKGVFL